MTGVSPDGELVIRRAGSAEVDQAARVLEDAIEWAAELGFDSWPPGTFSDPGAWGHGRLLEALDSHGLFLARRAGETLATFSLLPEDQLFWPDAVDDGLYLHRFAVRRAHPGAGIGAQCLQFMREEVGRAGHRFLRLDCLAENPGIRRYYERAGFEHRGDTVVNDMRFSLYELDASGTRN
ncbi:MAG: GNAT family N-acetyltransferase [Actinomycetota bacterium]